MKRKVIVKFMCIFFAVVFLAGFFTFGGVANAHDNSSMGGIKVEVISEDGDKICGAKVFVCEISQCFETGKSGQTENISVPVLPDTRFLDICKKDFGELTLLVTKDGYCPTCVTGVIVRKDITRLGPKVVLKVGSENRHVADSIDEAWLKRFCDKYTKGAVNN